jgi:hypothetical protein
LTSRNYTIHTNSTSQPPSATLGDEWFDPVANKLYKLVAVGGTSVQWTEVINTTTANTVTVSNIRVSNTATLTGSIYNPALSLPNIVETVALSTQAVSGVINLNLAYQTVFYFTAAAGANWTPNFRASDTTALNSIMAIGQSISCVIMATQGTTAYYSTAVLVDGASITPKWQSGTAPTAGNASSVDVYTYTIVKTANATFTVFASQTKFA